MTAEPDEERGLRLLGASYALSWFSIALVAGPGSAALVALTGELSHAGLFIAVYFVGAAVGGAVGGRFKDRLGARRMLAGAHLQAAIGFALAGTGVLMTLLELFVVGVLVLASAAGAILLTRLAATELVPPAERGRAMGVVQRAALAGAIAGPLILLVAEPASDAIGRPALGLIWFLAPPLYLVAAALVHRAPDASPGKRVLPPLAAGASPALGGPTRALLAGGASVAFSQAAMVMAMGVTGAAMAAAGHGLEALGVVMAFHFAGMFGLSREVGALADRWGRRPTMALGLAILGAGGLTMAYGPGLVALAGGLLLVGVGWSFGYIAGSLVVADVTVPERSGRVLGLVDLVTAVAAAGASIVGGWYYAREGMPGLGVLALGLVLLPLFLTLALREPVPGAYARPQDA